MSTIDRWVVRAAFYFLRRHAVAAGPTPLATCAINLSGQSLCEDQFLDFVVDQLQRVDITPAQICFEITETAAVTHLTRAMRFIATLKGMGCRFALDDFGSGLSLGAAVVGANKKDFFGPVNKSRVIVTLTKTL